MLSYPFLAGMSPDQEKGTEATDAAAFQSLLNKAHGQRKGEVPVYRIVLTGGPCGGKSTALAHISDRYAAV
jgi:hypothetical protein